MRTDFDARPFAVTFSPLDAIRVLRNVDNYGVSIPPLHRLKVLRTLLHNLVSGYNPLGLRSPPLNRELLDFFRMLAKNEHLEDPYMTALMYQAYFTLSVSNPDRYILADSPRSLASFSKGWSDVPLTTDEGIALMAMVDSFRLKLPSAAAAFDKLPLIHVHRHRERLLELYQRSSPPVDLQETESRHATSKKDEFLPWQSSLAMNRLKLDPSRSNVSKKHSEPLSSGKFRAWVDPVLDLYPDDPVVLLLALQLADRTPARTRDIYLNAVLDRVGEVQSESDGWRLVREDDDRLGQARTLARRTIELGLAEVGSLLGRKTLLWERLLQ